MPAGTIKNVSGRGYAFIARDDGERDIFVHASDSAIDLAEGARVIFEVGPGNDGRSKAIKVVAASRMAVSPRG